MRQLHSDGDTGVSPHSHAGTFPCVLSLLREAECPSSNRAAIGHLHRQRYGRRYPVLLVGTDGSTVRLRYREPKRILMVRARPRGCGPECPGGSHPVPAAEDG
uniref:Mitochondrial ribosomal protein L55 n=1 Tax=Taeniopygia guttata TaxID=59729 RepID=A0A674H619_TAEGU